MIDFVPFIFVKMSALLALTLVFALPVLVGAVVGFLFDLWDSPVARFIYRTAAYTFFAAGYISYCIWIWPFDVPREKSWVEHVPGAWVNVVTESLPQYRKRNKLAEPPTRIDLGTEIRRYELVSWNPPKHFYVTIKDAVTGQLYEGLYVSKHCNTAGQLKHGEQYNVRVRYFEMSNAPGEKKLEFVDLYSTFCG